VDEEVAHVMSVDVDHVQTRTTYLGEVPTEVAARVVGEVPPGARTTAQVILSTLPGGQVLRTVKVRTRAPQQDSTFDAEHLNPVDARTAERRPVVIGSPEQGPDQPLTLWIVSPGGSAVRAVSPQPNVWPWSAKTPVVNGVARIELRVSMLTVEEQYSIEVLSPDGTPLGSFPTTSGDPELSAP